MRSATALRACIRHLQHESRVAAPRRLPSSSRKLSGSAIVRTTVPKDKARDMSTIAATAAEADVASARRPPANPSYFNFRLSRPLVASLALVLGGTAVGIWFPPDLQVAYHPEPRVTSAPSPRRMTAPLSEAARLENTLTTLPALLALRRDAFEKRETDSWRETRHIPTQSPTTAGKTSHNGIFASALYGPSKIAIPPLIRERADGLEGAVVLHVGTHLCGHDGIVHGGLVATLFDHYLYRFGVLNLEARVAATARLEVNYKAPVRADQWLILRAHREEDGRKPHKVAVIGRLEDVDGNVLAEARGVFVTPRNANQFFKPTDTAATP